MLKILNFSWSNIDFPDHFACCHFPDSGHPELETPLTSKPLTNSPCIAVVSFDSVESVCVFGFMLPSGKSNFPIKLLSQKVSSKMQNKMHHRSKVTQGDLWYQPRRFETNGGENVLSGKIINFLVAITIYEQVYQVGFHYYALNLNDIFDICCKLSFWANIRKLNCETIRVFGLFLVHLTIIH